jgi:hypothetical protein
MSVAQFTIPLIVQTAGNVIIADEAMDELTNIANNLNPAGVGGYQDNNTQKHLQEDPSTGLAPSMAKELEQLRFQVAAATGETLWDDAPANDIKTLDNDIKTLDTDVAALKATTAVSSTLAWALLDIENAGVITIVAGHNIGSASWSGSNITIGFTNNLSSANYIVHANAEGPGTTITTTGIAFIKVNTGTRAMSGFTLRVHRREGTGATLSATDVVFVQVIGAP